jgi:glycosyltransferase involved in cell wall biosynthesis
MRILYDYQIFSSQNYGGISRYFFELLRRFADDDAIDCELALRYSNNSYLSGSGVARCEPFFDGKKFPGKTTLIEFLNRLQSRGRLLRGGFDVFHPTYYNPYYIKHLGAKPCVVTVYDMVHELYPEMYPASETTRQWKKQVLAHASKIIAISENTRQDVTRLYGIDEKQIDVIPLASSLQTAGPAPEPQVSVKYLLFVGQRLRYKNFPFFIRAAASVLRRDHDLNIVCVGGGTFSPEESALFEALGMAGRISQQSVSDETLTHLYRNATAFIFPSLYEGFGIPVLEAFGCGCPVVLARSSCFPEVAGDAALYFDPNDEASLRVILEKICGDENLREEMRNLGNIRGREFSWDKTAVQTKAVYESLI